MTTTTMKRSWLLGSLKVGLYSLVICTFLVLLFALVIKLFALPQDVIPVVNQAIKIISVALSSLLYVREDNGFVKGGLGGVIFCVFSVALFALLGGEFSFSHVLIDLGISFLVGGVTGAIAVNRRR